MAAYPIRAALYLWLVEKEKKGVWEHVWTAFKKSAGESDSGKQCRIS